MNDSAISPNLGLVKKLLLVLPGKLYVLFTLFQNEQASGEKIKTPVEKRKLYMLQEITGVTSLELGVLCRLVFGDKTRVLSATDKSASNVVAVFLHDKSPSLSPNRDYLRVHVYFLLTFFLTR